MAKYPKTVFILGTNRNIGKSVTCIGIICKLLSESMGYTTDEIGYIKPVGQETLTVVDGRGVSIEADKDAVLITSLMGIECPGYDKTSPLVWQSGVTADFIDEAGQGDPIGGCHAFMDRIRDAYEHVCQNKRIVIVEGTGQPGVGSVAGVSNADVINLLREMGVPVYAVMVASGGIGSTIDQIFPYLMSAEHMGTRIDGIIINSVFGSKIDKIQHYIETYYDKVFPPIYGKYMQSSAPPPILGFVPAVPELGLPTMRLIAEYFGARPAAAMEIIAPQDFDNGACRLVRDIKVLSLDFGYESLLRPGDAVIIGVNANDAILAMLLLHERMVRRQGTGLAGMILSCKQVGGLASQIRDLIERGDLPTITLDYDSADIVARIEGMTIKIQPYDVGKKELIAKAFDRSLHLWPDLNDV
jgi:uncharacterized protein